ncbi:peptidase G2 autoproteolytic cleavage domain-containing protein [Bacillus paranthracis]
MLAFFVTLDGEFIRKATAQDEYILGITNDSPSILGNSAEMRWKEKYLVDEWGRIQFENINDSGAIEKRAILNPKWSPEKKYISRIERSEWVAVGLLGQMRVRDDGKCVVGSYCLPNMEGIATSSNTGYRVIKRITPNQIMIIFK